MAEYFFCLIFALLIYSSVFYLLIKRRTYTAIAFYSFYYLLIITFCLFVCNITYLVSMWEFDLIDKTSPGGSNNFMLDTFFPFVFILSHLTKFVIIILNFIMQFKFIELTSTLNSKGKALKFYNKRYIFNEKFRVKILVLFVMLLSLGLVFYSVKNGGEVAVAFHLMTHIFVRLNSTQEAEAKEKYHHLIKQSYTIFTYLSFFESLFYITYIYKIYFSTLKRQIKRIYFMLLLSLLLYFPLVFWLGSYNKETYNNSVFGEILFNIFNYLQLIFYVLFPLRLSFKDKVKISKSFNPKLVSNLYLFLSDEICYYSFLNYLSPNEIDMYFLASYTNIMKFKYKFSIEAEYGVVLREAKNLYEFFFKNKKNTSVFSEEFMEKIMKSCDKLLNNDQCSYEMYDEILVSSFEFLQAKFDVYKRSRYYLSSRWGYY